MKLRLASILFLFALALPALAGAPMPEIPKGKGDKCIGPVPEMRVNHMEMILHQRDETMYMGLRTKKHSLRECINCHAVNGEDGQPVSIESPKHFCNVCHRYAAVRIDCFQCHNSKPEPVQPAAMESADMGAATAGEPEAAPTNE